MGRDEKERKKTVIKAYCFSEYAANLLYQYTERTVPGYADIIGTAETNVTVTVNTQAVTRQEYYPSSPLPPSSGLWRTLNPTVAMQTLPGLCPSVPLILCHFSYDYMSRGVGKVVYKWTDSTTNWVEQSASAFLYDSWNLIPELLDIGAGTPSSRILAHYEYSPFGETIVATGDLAKANPFRFSTKYTDNEISLLY